MTSFRIVLLLTVVAVQHVSSNVTAQPPTPLIRSVWPSVGSLGQVAEVAVRGDNLAEDAVLICSNPGIIAERQTEPPATIAGEVVFKLTIPADAVVGLVDLRIGSAGVVSNPKRFAVVAGPSRAIDSAAVQPNEPKSESDASAATAELQIGETIHSICQAEHPAVFAISLEAGQSMDLVCRTISIDSVLATYLTILNDAGEVVHQHAAAKLSDLHTIFVPPRSGRYLITLHDQLYRGGEPYYFHLSINRTELFKRIQLPRENSTRLPSGPLAASGSIQGAFDATKPAGVEFEFEAVHSDRWSIEVFSRRFGAITDPDLILSRVRDSAPENPPKRERLLVIDDREYNGNSLLGYRESDPGAIWTVPENGRYHLQVRDLQTSSEPDANKDYCLVIRKPVPSFFVRTIVADASLNVATTAPGGASILRGGRIAIEVAVFEIDQFLQHDQIQVNPELPGSPREILINADRLPSGITAEPLRLTRHQTKAHLILQASDEMPSWTGSIKLIATSTHADGTVVTHDVEPWMIQLADPDGRGRPLVRPTDAVWVATDDRHLAPVSVDVEAGEAGFVGKHGGTLDIPVTIARQPSATGKVVIRAADLPPHVTATELTLEGETLGGNITLTIPANTPVANYKIFLNGETEVAWPQADGSTANRRWFTPSNSLELRIDA